MNTGVEMCYTSDEITEAVVYGTAYISTTVISQLTASGAWQSELDVARAIVEAAKALLDEKEAVLIS